MIGQKYKWGTLGKGWESGLIQVNDKWCIDVDRYNYSPVLTKNIRRRIKDGVEVTECSRESYHTSLEAALSWICERETNEALSKGSPSLAEAVGIIRDEKKKFSELLTKLIRGE